MGLFDDIGAWVDTAVKDVGRAVEDAVKTVAGVTGDAAPGAVVGAVVGTILLGPIGGVIGAVSGGVISTTPTGNAIEEHVAEAVENVVEAIPAPLPGGAAVVDNSAAIIDGMRGLIDANRPQRRAAITIGAGDNDPNARTALEPGADTAITVQVARLQGNSNVKRIVATLFVADAIDVPAAQPTVATVDSTASAKLDTVAVTIATARRPRNVTVRLDGGSAFWTHAASLDDAQYALPDFSAAVNAYLDSAAFPGDGVPLRFLVRSDTPGRVGIHVDEAGIDATVIHMQSWTNALDRTVHLDRALTLDFAAVQEIALAPVDAPPAGRRVSMLRVTAEVGGTLGAERLLGEVSGTWSAEAATVSAEYAVAQRTTPDVALQCVGISALLENTAPARLYVELQPEIDDGPGAGAPLASAELALPAPGPTATGPAWIYITFDRPGAIEAGRAYWMVLRGIEGEARLALEPSGATFGTGAVMSRGGQRWRAVAPGGAAPAAMLRLVHLPGPETSSAAIEIEVRRAPVNGTRAATTLARQHVDPQGRVTSVALALGTGVEREALTLVVRSHARGTVNLTNVTQEYALG